MGLAEIYMDTAFGNGIPAWHGELLVRAELLLEPLDILLGPYQRMLLER